MELTIHTNGIALIEFLGDGEYKTGKSLFDSYIKPTWTDCDNKFYFYAPTKHLLLEALSIISKASEEQGFSPIVHIESHGTEDGLSPTRSNRDFVTWRELKPYFQKINRYSEFNTLVFISACSGAHFVSALDATDAAPFWAIIGPMESACAENLLEDFGNFYRRFLSNFDFFDAFKIMNQHSLDGRKYHLYTADHFFINLWARYLQSEGSPKVLEKRVARIMSKAPSIHGAGKKAYGQLKSILITHLGNHPAYFEKFRRRYFMEDLFPGMADRFGVTYEKVIKKVSDG